MSNKFFILPVLMCCSLLALAVPALPGWHTFTQSDGTTLKVQTVGNAFNNAILTADGLTVARGSDGDFYYHSSLTGLTAVRAHEAGERTAAENAFVNAQRGHLSMTMTSYQMPKHNDMFAATGSNASAAVPAMGERRIPIILVEFKDKKFANTREKIIESMLTGSESVGQYFHDQSNGMYQPVFDVYGIYCLSEDREYYGGHSGTGKDKGIGWMVTEACQLAAADGVSFQPYDTNNDYYCDVVILIYAGVSEAQASYYHPEAIWPCNWTLEAAQYYSRGGNGAFSPGSGDPYVNHFAVFNELHGSNDNGKTIDGIGTFCHEFGHCLGLPDMYDTGNNDNYGMGNWDIMCLGCYCNDGYTPVGYSAYEKAFMGWVDYITPEPNTYYTLPVWNQKNKDTDKAVRIVSSVNRNEYFIFENRQRQGWDRFLPGQGIMVTHITYSANQWTYNKPNNEKIQLITLLPADNKLTKYTESGDLWPNGSKRAVTDDSTPSTKLNMDATGNITGNAGYLGKPVTEMVINRDGTASFWYMKEDRTTPVMQPVNTEYIKLSEFRADWSDQTPSEHVASYTLEVKSLTVNNTGKLNASELGDDTYRLVSGITDRFYTVSDLLPAGTFAYKVKAVYTNGSESTWSNIEQVTLVAADGDYEVGDVNQDGMINMKDVSVLIVSLLSGVEAQCADVNGDGTVGVGDVATLIKRLLSTN